MGSINMGRAALLTGLIVVIAVISWEVFLRSKGHKISYDNLEPLWADKRAMVYKPVDEATVFIGSSRIKYDLDVPTWEKLTGTKAIQLACEGSNPNPILQDLANDKNFKGRLVIDVTEGLFFSPPDGPNAERSKKVLKYYNEITPAQKAGFFINHVLESRLVFLDKEDLSLPAFLDKLQIPSRKGVMMLPYFPMEFSRIHFSRQAYMTPPMMSDTNIQKRVTDIWDMYRNMGSRFPPAGGDTLLKMMEQVKMATDKIVARGGTIIFLRTPSSNPMLMGEQMVFAREKYWEKLLAITGCQGIHFLDYPAINHFICPEWSHLSPADAITFTTELVKILQQDKAWSFSKSSSN